MILLLLEVLHRLLLFDVNTICFICFVDSLEIFSDSLEGFKVVILFFWEKYFELPVALSDKGFRGLFDCYLPYH